MMPERKNILGVAISAVNLPGGVPSAWGAGKPMSRRIQPLSIILFVADMSLVPLGMWIATILRSTIPLGQGGALPAEHVGVPLFVYGFAVLCWAVGLGSSGAYDPRLALRWFNEAWRVVWGAVLATILLAGFIFMTFRELSRLQFVYFFLITVGAMLGYRAALRLFYRTSGKARPGGRSRALVIGAGDLGERVAKVLLDHSRWGFEPIGFLDDDPSKHGQSKLGLPILGPIEHLGRLAEEQRVDEAWIALPISAHGRLLEVLAALERHPVRVKVVPDYFALALVRAKADIWSGMPIIGLRDPLIEGIPRLVKRLFDLVVTLLLLIPALPAMGIIALLIRLDSAGPVLLKQQRVGENGRLFEMFKFRTMHANAEAMEDQAAEEPQAYHKQKEDPRVTRIGHFLRRWSLDELPQLWNVLLGDMSLVGPRPEMPWLVDRYEPWQRKRFSVPQGLTGWWQINGRSERPMHLHTEDDLFYLYNWSIWLDLKILLKTPLAVFQGRGAF